MSKLCLVLIKVNNPWLKSKAFIVIKYFLKSVRLFLQRYKLRIVKISFGFGSKSLRSPFALLIFNAMLGLKAQWVAI